MTHCSLNAKEGSLEEECSTTLPPLRICWNLQTYPFLSLSVYIKVELKIKPESHGRKQTPMSTFCSSTSDACLAPSSCQSFKTSPFLLLLLLLQPHFTFSSSSSSSSSTPFFLNPSFQSFRTLHAISCLELFITPGTMAMTFKFKHVRISFILWLSLLFILLFLYGFFNFNSYNTRNSINTHHSSFLSGSSNRKILASRFDFTPFLHRHRHRPLHRHRSHMPAHQQPAESEIDTRYGADKRLVPTGPNPLHH